ncbi:unnamed protein product, partial [Rotaria socialis]
NYQVQLQQHQQQQQLFQQQQQQIFQQYYPMMSAQGILIEIMDDEEAKNANSNEANGPTHDTNHAAKELLFMVTVNGHWLHLNWHF